MAGRIFLSYSHGDERVASRIFERLSEKSLAPWIDRQEIRPGESFVGGMNQGLDSASYVLVLFSAASAQSRWVQREWESALGANVPVLPVLLDGGQIPPILKDIVYFDLRADESAGIERIVSFFESEDRRIPKTATRAVSESPLNGATKRQIRQVAVRCLDESEINAFCFDADLDVKSLRGASVMERILSLLHEVANEDLLVQFANWVVLEKPRCVEKNVIGLKSSGAWNWP